ncbi:hypothetical protein B0H13DRAFT_2280114 [Mycena leptocephala]|nr:hypothetical protein B0H13DRAFT_2280114 [Mycena leptocephala]
MKVIVDDNSPLVQYNFFQVNDHKPNGWIRLGKAPEFEASDHASATPGDTAKLTFNGTSISVFGTLAGPSSNGRTRWNFDIDGIESGLYDAPPASPRIQNQHFWTSPDLDATSHTLTITVDQDTLINPNRTIFLDYFVYTPSPTSAAGKTILFDDSDDSISYSPQGWQSLENTPIFLESTQHVSESAGSWIALTFEGTQISLNGIAAEGFQASVDIDNNSTVLGFAGTNIQLFTSSVLSSGSHTLNITALNGNSFAVDYFLVTTTLDATTAPVSTTSSLPSASPNATGSSSDSNLPTGAPQRAPNAGAQNNTPIGAIIGSALGGLVILALIFVAVLIRRHRAKHHPSDDRQAPIIPLWMGRNADDQTVTAVRPFLPPPDDENAEPPPYTLKYLPTGYERHKGRRSTMGNFVVIR